mgnify:CR=1 FL=1
MDVALPDDGGYIKSYRSIGQSMSDQIGFGGAPDMLLFFQGDSFCGMTQPDVRARPDFDEHNYAVAFSDNIDFREALPDVSIQYAESILL